MTPTEWFTFTVTAIPLFGIAGSAVAFVTKLYHEAAERKRKRFFELLQFVDGTGPIAAKLGAIYALRDFPEHASFIKRFCETQSSQIAGANAQSLANEMSNTAKAMSKWVK